MTHSYNKRSRSDPNELRIGFCKCNNRLRELASEVDGKEIVFPFRREEFCMRGFLINVDHYRDLCLFRCHFFVDFHGITTTIHLCQKPDYDVPYVTIFSGYQLGGYEVKEVIVDDIRERIVLIIDQFPQESLMQWIQHMTPPNWHCPSVPVPVSPIKLGGAL